MTKFSFLHSTYFSDTYPDEWDAVQKHFPIRSDDVDSLPSGTVVVPRYRAIPFGAELEAQVLANGSRLINSYAQHLAVDDIFDWTQRLGDLTAPSYRVEDMSGVTEGRFFVKGNVSSMKHRGVSSCYADSKDEALALAEKVTENPYLAGQIAVIRPLQDYMLLGSSEHGLPIWHEQRVFTYQGRILGYGMYWGYRDTLRQPPPIDSGFFDTVNAALERLGGIADFLVLDMAQYMDGHWGVVELNDGSHSGFPSTVSPDEVFGNLVKLSTR